MVGLNNNTQFRIIVNCYEHNKYRKNENKIEKKKQVKTAGEKQYPYRIYKILFMYNITHIAHLEY